MGAKIGIPGEKAREGRTSIFIKVYYRTGNRYFIPMRLKALFPVWLIFIDSCRYHYKKNGDIIPTGRSMRLN